MYSYTSQIQVTPENVQELERFGHQFGYPTLSETRQKQAERKKGDPLHELINDIGVQVAAQIFEMVVHEAFKERL